MRAVICGGPELHATAGVLGLVELQSGAPEIVLIDLRDPNAFVRAGQVAPSVPRIVVADSCQEPLLRALGFPALVASSCAPAVLGPLIQLAVPPTPRGSTSIVVVTAPGGGVGRTLLTANLAIRLAAQRPTWAIDCTGTGALAWWLRSTARPWSELEGLASELTAEHLRVIGAEVAPGLRVVGGGFGSPSAELLRAVTAAALATGDLILMDAPTLADLAAVPDTGSFARRVVLSRADPLSVAILAAVDLSDSWLVAAQGESLSVGTTFRTLPRDDSAVAKALTGPEPVGGKLGRAYDELAELVSIDAS